MELLVFGHGGQPMIVFPTSMGAFFEYEDRGMIAAVADKIEHGALQIICVSTLDTETFYARDRHPRARIERYLAYERYLLEDVVPFVKHLSGWHTSGVTGCSFGAYHAFTMALRHPDIFTSCITDGRRVHDHPVPRRVSRPRHLPAQPAGLPAAAARRLVPRAGTGRTNGSS